MEYENLYVLDFGDKKLNASYITIKIKDYDYQHICRVEDENGIIQISGGINENRSKCMRRLKLAYLNGFKNKVNRVYERLKIEKDQNFEILN